MMEYDDKIQHLHEKLKTDLCYWIDPSIEDSEFKKFIQRFNHKLTPKDISEIKTVSDLLNKLENKYKDYFGIANYENIKSVIKDFNVKIIHNVIEPIENEIAALQSKRNHKDSNSSENENNNKATLIVQSTSTLNLQNRFMSERDVPKCDKPGFEADGVDTILLKLGLQKYCDLFKDEEVNADVFWILNADLLKTMGVKVGDSGKILDYITVNTKKPVSKFSGENLHTELHPFQLELAERALNGENTIIYARTNTGKTNIAFHVILDHLKKKSKGKVVFMAKTNLLLEQQYKRAMDELNDKIVAIYRPTALEDRTEYTFEYLMKIYNVFFMTPQLLVNNLSRDDNRKVNISDFTLLVFDECHHTIKMNSYNKVMSFYRKCKFDPNTPNIVLPQILGLTASPPIKKAQNKAEAVNFVKELMANLDVVHLSTVVRETEDYHSFFDEPESVVLPVKDRDDDLVNKLLLNAICSVEKCMQTDQVREKIEALKQDSTLLSEINNKPLDKTSMRYTSWLHKTMLSIEELVVDFGNKTNHIRRYLHACLRHIEVYLSALKTNYLLDYKDVKEEMEQKFESLQHESQTESDENENEIVKVMEEVINKIPKELNSNPDIKVVVDTLEREYNEMGSKSRFLVFVEQRNTAKRLAEKLPEYLFAIHLTGSGASEEKSGLTMDEQNEVIERFKLGMHKCLVATSVAFEGIDIPDCNMTIRYKLDANTISSLQMRGRIRKHGKQFISANRKQVHKDELNIEREFIMKQAVEHIVKSSGSLQDEIKRLQKEALNREENRRVARDLSTKPSAKFQLHCRKCGEFICEGDFLRIDGVHRVVLDIDLINRIKTKPVKKKSRQFDGFVKKYKIEGPCKHDWGIILSRDNVDMVALSQDDIKIYNDCECKYENNIKKWTDFPFEILEIENREFEQYKKDVSTRL